MIKTLTEFDISGDISSLLDEHIQSFLPLQGGNQTITDSLVKSTKIMTSDPGIGFIGFMSELEDKHLEFGGVFICSALSSLVDGFGASNNISLTMGHQVMLFECFDELSE